MRRVGVIATAVLVVGLVSSGAFGMYINMYHAGIGGASIRVAPPVIEGINLESVDKLFQRAMNKENGKDGEPKAQYELGVLFYTMYNAARDEGLTGDDGYPFYLDRAAYWLRESAHADYAPAQFLLGYIDYWHLREVEAGKAWLDRAVEAGYPRAQATRARMLASGIWTILEPKEASDKRIVQERLNQAIELATKSAEQGDAYGMYELSAIYRRKDSPIYDQSKADMWLNKAIEAAKNDPTIEIFNANHVRFSAAPLTIEEINLEFVEKLFQKAMDKENEKTAEPKAQYELGVLLYTMYNATRHEGLTGDNGGLFYLNHAAYWLRKSANADYTPAQFLLGYIDFWHLQEDEAGGAWLDRAVEAGYSRAQAMQANILTNNALSRILSKEGSNRQIAQKALKQAIELATKSAKQGDAFGMYVLSRIYGNKDFSVYKQTKANEWKKKAIEAAKSDPTINFSDTEKPASKPQKPISSNDWYSGKYNGRTYQAMYRITNWTRNGDNYTFDIESRHGEKYTLSGRTGETIDFLPMPIQFTLPDWVEEIHVDEGPNFEILDDGTLKELELESAFKGDIFDVKFRKATAGNILLDSGRSMTLWIK